MAQTISITGQIQATDAATNTLTVQKLLSGLSFSASVSTTAEPVSIGTTPTVIGLPISPTQFVYIKNTHATQTLSVTWTPNGGSSNPVIGLQPSACLILMESNVTSGITALTLTGSSAGTTCEYILAG